MLKQYPRHGNKSTRHRSTFLNAIENDTSYKTFNSSALTDYPKNHAALKFSPRRVQIKAKINVWASHSTNCRLGHVLIWIYQTTPHIGNDRNQPCTIGDHQSKLCRWFSTKSSTISPLWFNILSVLRELEPDKMLEQIFGHGRAFGAILDWKTEQLSFRYSNVIITVSHRTTHQANANVYNTEHA